MDRSLTSNFDIHPLNSVKLHSTVHVLLKLLGFSAGPAGHIQALCNGHRGHVTYTSVCARLLPFLNVTSPEVKLVISSVQSHLQQNGDCGLFMACVCLHLIQSSLKSATNVHTQRSLFEKFLAYIVDYLNCSDCDVIVKADFTDVHVLLAYVKSVLCSKRLLNLTNSDVEQLSELILQTFVESLPSYQSNSKMFLSDCIDIVCLTKSSSTQSQLKHGVLLEYPELSASSEDKDIKSKIRTVNNSGKDATNQIKVAIVTCSLSGDMDEIVRAEFEITRCQLEDVENSILNMIVKFCDILEKYQVGLLLCQKVIHPKLKVALRLKGILFIERIGSQKIPYLQDLTSAQPLCSISQSANVDELLGSIDSMCHVAINQKSFLQLKNTRSSVVTLVLCAPWEDRLCELKVCVKSSLQGLYSLSKDPRLLAGGGCWLTQCSYLLKQRVCAQLPSLASEFGCTESQILSSLAIFRESLHYWVRSLANSSQEVLVDLSILHCWRVPKGKTTYIADNEVTHCCCGLKSVDARCLLNFELLSEHDLNFLTLNFNKNTCVHDNPVKSLLVLDNICAGMQALQTSVLTANLVLSIATTIIDRN